MVWQALAQRCLSAHSILTRAGLICILICLEAMPPYQRMINIVALLFVSMFLLSSRRVDRTYKLHIGGKQVRPDAPYVRSVVDVKGRTIGQVPEGNRKDLRNAVEASHAAFPGWSLRAAHNRAQIVYYM
jgi:hypothetical protein